MGIQAIPAISGHILFNRFGVRFGVRLINAAWLSNDCDSASLPLQRGAHHGAALVWAIQDCGPDRWGRMLIERAIRKKVLTQKPYLDIDYVLALDDVARVGALRFRVNSESPFLAATSGKLPPLVRLSELLRATNAIHSGTETAQDLRFLLGAGSPLGGARPKSAVMAYASAFQHPLMAEARQIIGR